MQIKGRGREIQIWDRGCRIQIGAVGRETQIPQTFFQSAVSNSFLT